MRAVNPKPWRPAAEAEAVATLSVFVEWLRATGPMAQATPARMRDWQAADPDAFLAHVAAFAGLDAARGVRCNLLRHDGTREALVLHDATGAQRGWSRDDVRQGRDLPAPVGAALDGMAWRDLLRLAADHLLIAGTRPDDRLVWAGDPAAPWPYGAWIVGAVVVLAGAVRPPASGSRGCGTTPRSSRATPPR